MTVKKIAPSLRHNAVVTTERLQRDYRLNYQGRYIFPLSRALISTADSLVRFKGHLGKEVEPKISLGMWLAMFKVAFNLEPEEVFQVLKAEAYQPKVESYGSKLLKHFLVSIPRIGE